MRNGTRPASPHCSLLILRSSLSCPLRGVQRREEPGTLFSGSCMETQHSPPLADARPMRRRWAVVSLLAVLLAAGLAWYLVFLSTAPPPPPNPEVSASEPAVAEVVQAARARVLKEPRSAEAWGELGKVFLANEME